MGTRKSATVVYWHDEENLVMDGGGLRALAWVDALRSLDYEAVVVPLVDAAVGVVAPGLARRAKQALVPMPFSRPLPPEAFESDVTVVTVPAVFRDAVCSRPAGTTLVLDWMDRWSTAARTIGDARLVSRPGGRLQARRWKRREVNLPPMADWNTAAGFADAEWISSNAGGHVSWLPTPVAYAGETTRRAEGVPAVGFIGNFRYAPNLLSLRDFLDAESRHLHAAGYRVVVAGYGSEVVRSWTFPGVEVLGEVDSPGEFYAAVDAAVVPIEHGSGIKVKAVEALAHGLPVFGTDHVRDGIGPRLREYVLPLEQLRSPGVLSSYRGPTRGAFESELGMSAFRARVHDGLEDVVARC